MSRDREFAKGTNLHHARVLAEAVTASTRGALGKFGFATYRRL